MTEQQPFPLESEQAEAASIAATTTQAFDAEAYAPLSAGLLDDAVRETMRLDADMRGSLANLRVRSAQMDFDTRLARMFAESGQFDDLKKLTPKQAVATALLKIEIGRSYGLAAGIAMQCVYIVKGIPSIKAEVLAARMRQAGYDWRIKIHTDKICTLYPMKNGEYMLVQAVDEKGNPIFEAGKPKMVPGEVTYTIEDAKRAKLVKADGAWETVPRNMLFWRAISNMKRFFAPEVGIPIPSTEEMQEERETQRPNIPLPIGNHPDGTLAVERMA